MKLLLIFSFLISGLAFAQVESRIEANLRCEQPGGSIAIKTGASAQTARAWQADIGDTQGLEIELTSFSLTGPGHMTFEGIIFGIVPVKGSIRNFILSYDAKDENLGWRNILSGVKCLPSKK